MDLCEVAGVGGGTQTVSEVGSRVTDTLPVPRFGLSTFPCLARFGHFILKALSYL